MTEEPIARRAVILDGRRVSYLRAGEGPPVLLLHGTFWSRVWLPVIPKLAESHEVFALDYPGFGRSAGRLEGEEAAVPALAEFVLRAVDALRIGGPFALAGRDTGGAVAQHVAVSAEDRVSKLALVNSVLYDSWPVPALSRFRDDPEYARNITSDELVEQRREALRKATTRELSEAEKEEYLSPRRTEDGTRSWTAMAEAADVLYPGAGGAAQRDGLADAAPVGRGRRVTTHRLRAALRSGDTPDTPRSGARRAPHPDGGRSRANRDRAGRLLCRALSNPAAPLRSPGAAIPTVKP